MSLGSESEGSIRVAVYGTLKAGMVNSHLLARALFLGTDSLSQIVLYDLGDYPAARRGTSNGVEVEVFEINPETLLVLDALEEYDPTAVKNSLYRRERIHTAFGNAWIYIYNGSLAGRRSLQVGSWKPRNALCVKRDAADQSRSEE